MTDIFQLQNNLNGSFLGMCASLSETYVLQDRINTCVIYIFYLLIHICTYMHKIHKFCRYVFMCSFCTYLCVWWCAIARGGLLSQLFKMQWFMTSIVLWAIEEFARLFLTVSLLWLYRAAPSSCIYSQVLLLAPKKAPKGKQTNGKTVWGDAQWQHVATSAKSYRVKKSILPLQWENSCV